MLKSVCRHSDINCVLSRYDSHQIHPLHVVSNANRLPITVSNHSFVIVTNSILFNVVLLSFIDDTVKCYKNNRPMHRMN